ncbi:MAG: putative lipid II flippase FtsW [endosymbiont of Galathealinum brachiosum]|uniref:Probable peptidoglycan glycosyltransferase FtsW n=1 Tax=endosymbiont of Galathealinum brachiosum TaxID=2200906 RepID=A0A370D9T1_9GAMM|nr:MAG: putative lipid II flippase FtsW [endosymbiont of Galathealinum brachiosum]
MNVGLLFQQTQNIVKRGSAKPMVQKPLMLDGLDGVLIMLVISILAIGLVMVASASISIADSKTSTPFFYLYRQLIAASLGLVAAIMIFKIRLVYWEKSGMILLALSFAMVILVLIPGVGKTVNGSTRWIPIGILNLQVSEIVKLFLMIYVAGYLVRHGEQVRSTLWGFLKPMMMIGLVCMFLLLEPDFGASVVIMMTVLGMTFLAGVRFTQFVAVITLFGSAAALLVITSPYRLQRLTAFVNPWADPFDSGFQLTQSLIAIGSGGWTGVGLGSSVQKLFYLPEAHTDFLFAVLAEELGLIGVVLVISLYTALVFRAFMIARKAESCGNQFASYLSYGIGIWLGLQAFINIGVNMGVLPTKGLTLPLMSYGGSSLIVVSASIGLLLRISYECSSGQAKARKSSAGKKRKAKTGSTKKRNKDIGDLIQEAA